MAREDAQVCQCEKCNSYPDCAIEPHLKIFCQKGKAPCEIQLRGCQCRACGVYEKYGFIGDTFCLKGRAEKLT
jgi:hypothetical protein